MADTPKTHKDEGFLTSLFEGFSGKDCADHKGDLAYKAGHYFGENKAMMIAGLGGAVFLLSHLFSMGGSLLKTGAGLSVAGALATQIFGSDMGKKVTEVLTATNKAPALTNG